MNNQGKNNTSVNFSLRLLEIMRRRDLTQKDLATLTDLSQGAVSKYLRGVSLPKSLELYKMSKVLGVPMEWLMGDDEPLCENADDYWHQEAIRLKAKLDMAVSTLQGALQSLTSQNDEISQYSHLDYYCYHPRHSRIEAMSPSQKFSSTI